MEEFRKSEWLVAKEVVEYKIGMQLARTDGVDYVRIPKWGVPPVTTLMGMAVR